MTVCIGTICEKGDVVIVTTDRMWTSPYLSIEYEYPESKIEKLSPTCVAAVAGVVVFPTEAFERVRDKIEREGIRSISGIAYTLRDEYAEERKKRVDDDIFRPRSMTIDEFYGGRQKALDPNLVQMLDAEVMSYKFELDILVAGVDRKGHLYVIFPPGRIEPFERVGYIAIGSGSPHAQSTFIVERYSPEASFDKALYLTYKAKKIAERAPGVGPSTDMVVVTKEKIFDVPDDVKNELQKTFESEMSVVANKEQLLQNLSGNIQKFIEEVLKC